MRVERTRQSLSLTQNEVAAACGISQGHYSKVLGGLKTGKRTERALLVWLANAGAGRGMGRAQRERRMEALADSIRRDSAALVAIARLGAASDTTKRG